jgi:type I restriction enzyme M protein
MLTSEIKQKIDSARNILVGKIPTPTGQVEQITLALVYKFMNDIDEQNRELGGTLKFFIGDYQKYAWKNLLDKSLSAYERVTAYGEGLEKMHLNPNLPQFFRNVFRGAFLPFRDPEVLTIFLKQIDEFRYGVNGDLGDAFEYLLQVMGTQGDAGQFLTPRHHINFIVSVVDPQKTDKTLDPAEGTAGFLISAYLHILKQNTKPGSDLLGSALTYDERKKLSENFVGYDISHDMVRLSLVNLYLHGFADPRIYEYDTLGNVDRWDDDFDCILTNPPFMTPKGGVKPHKRFSIQAKRSEVLFVDYIMEHLNPNGKAGIIIPEGIIFQSATAYKALRKMMIDQNFLYAVVSLPAGIFQPYSGVKTSILFMDRVIAKKTKDILFVKVENDGFDLGAQRRPIEKNDLPRVTEIIKRYKLSIQTGKSFELSEEDKQISSLVPIEKIGKSGDYNLSGDRYKETIALVNQKWPMVELGEICDLYQPVTITSKEITEKGIYKVYGANGVIGYYDKYNHEDGEVLVTCRGATCGTINMSEPRCWITGNAMVVHPLDERVDKKFLYFFLRNSDLTGVISGSAQPQITRTSLSPFEIPLPPLEVQQEIVSQLDSYQKIINGAKQVVDNYKPEIKIDPEWEMVSLREITEINPSSKEIRSLDPTTKVSFIPMSDLNEKQITFAPKQTRNLSEVLNGYTYFKDEDVLLAKITPCFENGKAGIASNLVNGIGFGSTEFIVFRIYVESVIPQWIYHFVSDRNFLQLGKNNMTGSAGQQRLSPDFVKSYKIPIPPLDIQKQIVSRIEEEQQLVDATKKLIQLYQDKIKEKIDEVWGE